ncbi:hypothetical protein GCM10009098_28950 [Rheinheimera aquimaris]|uniref:Uncharacterized protein n=1 Tax=Rheinheimera aquimaris TaxID=412437 RepID=A0ABN1E4S6_9GAMM|nr:hypothetical protein [Rheinheimera aquimaris]MCB5214503.1 hypothetical protein [Rheinheimera aquimaris]
MSALSSTALTSNQIAVRPNQIPERTATMSAVLTSSTLPAAPDTDAEPQRESVRVSSTIGRAASAGQLSRQEAVDIYRQIASLL